ncbi:broad-complex core protein isoforms 1/2/3/4/5-like isoform X2 [Planococcus citri]|uniref:broad-complex core protein isoforms 1/2/3/4/5-like isoform X2 n=1 Tax=Planococcus citri TaxID=170843 RepID=UPI0031F97FEE
MEDLQHFCLRWNNYRNSITTAFENLRDDEDFIDVTLACDGKTLKAHRVVLSACSPYFRELLKSTPCKHPVIVLQDVVFDDLHALVEFIYHGEVNVHQRNLTSFLKTAEVLKVSGLTQQNAAVTATTLPSSAPPILDHYNENLSTRFPTRSPGTPSEKMNQFQQHFLYNTNQSQISLVNDENRLAQLQTIRHRRHLRSLTPIRCSQSQDDSPISPKRTKSAENALQSPLSNCSNIFSLSPSTISNDETTSRMGKNSCETLSSSHRNSPNEIVSPTIANTNRNTNNSMPISTTTATTTTTTSSSLPSSSPCSSSATTVEIPVNTVTTSKANSPIKYDENHNNYKDNNHSNGEQDIDKDEEEEPPVDFSITSSDNYVKKYNHPENIHRTTSNSSPSPKNLSLKCEPKDEAFGNNSSAAGNDHDNFNDNDSNLSEDRLSDQSPPSNVPYPQALLDAEDAFQGHPGYLASLRFNMAAAALAGFNHHQSHTAVTANAVLDGLTAPSQGLKKVFPCLACGKVLCSKASLKRHVADKHASHQEEYRCAICERVYCSRNSLMTHIYTYHKTRPTLLMPPPHHATTSNSHATDIKF